MKWIVTRSDGLTDEIEAERSWMDEGVAGFSNEIDEVWNIVAAYAPGQWNRVELVVLASDLA